MKIKKISIILPLIILIITLIIPSVKAIYIQGTTSTIKSKFKVEYEVVYIRATIITYWIDPKNNQMVAKTGWDFDDSKISNKWTKVDKYYYYNGVLGKSVLNSSNVPENNELVDKNLSISSLTKDDLSIEKYSPKYKIVYEILEANQEGESKSCEVAWGIKYNSDGIPSKI